MSNRFSSGGNLAETRRGIRFREYSMETSENTRCTYAYVVRTCPPPPRIKLPTWEEHACGLSCLISGALLDLTFFPFIQDTPNG